MSEYLPTASDISVQIPVPDMEGLVHELVIFKDGQQISLNRHDMHLIAILCGVTPEETEDVFAELRSLVESREADA